jgi:hypothetical protein
MAVVVALGLSLSACDQGSSQGTPFGGLAASPGQDNNPDLAPVAGRDPVDSPATSPGGTATLGSYDGGSAQQ